MLLNQALYHQSVWQELSYQLSDDLFLFSDETYEFKYEYPSQDWDIIYFSKDKINAEKLSSDLTDVTAYLINLESLSRLIQVDKVDEIINIITGQFDSKYKQFVVNVPIQKNKDQEFQDAISALQKKEY